MSNLDNMTGEKPLGDMQYMLPPELLQGFAFSGVAFTAATPAETSLMQAGARQWEQERAFQNEKNDAVETIVSRMPVGRDTTLNALLEQIKRSQTPGQLQSAVSAIEAAIASAERLYSEQNDPEVRAAEVRLQQAWAAFDRADKQLDEAFQNLPLTEEQRREYDRLKEQERIARERYDNNPTTENMQSWQASTRNTSNYVDETVEQGVASGQFTPAQGAPVIAAKDERDERVEQTTTAAFDVMNLKAERGSPDSPVLANENAAAQTISSYESMGDLNIAAAQIPQLPVVSQAVETARFETAEISVSETGQFVPAGAGQAARPASGLSV